jgi:uncharacterized membrane protein
MAPDVDFARLAAAGLVWFALHAAVAGSGLRFWLVARLGEKAYRGAFSIASVLVLWWLVHEYGRARYQPLWVTPQALSYVPLLLMPIAFVLLAGAFMVSSPTVAGAEGLLQKADAHGVLRITRHPFLWSVVLWATAHLAARADIGSYLFFGSLGLTALRGAFDIDRKRRRTHPEAFARLEAATSNVPLAALFHGRTHLVVGELVWPILGGLALALGSIALHPHFFRVSALPGFG